jgi:hypothetical protein
VRREPRPAASTTPTATTTTTHTGGVGDQRDRPRDPGRESTARSRQAEARCPFTTTSIVTSNRAQDSTSFPSLSPAATALQTAATMPSRHHLRLLPAFIST